MAQDVVDGILLSDPRFCDLFQSAVAAETMAGSLRVRLNAARQVGELAEVIRLGKQFRAAFVRWTEADLALQDQALGAIERWLDAEKPMGELVREGDAAQS